MSELDNLEKYLLEHRITYMGLSSFNYCPNCGARMKGGAE